MVLHSCRSGVRAEVTFVGTWPLLDKLAIWPCKERKRQLTRIRQFLKLRTCKTYYDREGRKRCVGASLPFATTRFGTFSCLLYIRWHALARFGTISRRDPFSGRRAGPSVNAAVSSRAGLPSNLSRST